MQTQTPRIGETAAQAAERLSNWLWSVSSDNYAAIAIGPNRHARRALPHRVKAERAAALLDEQAERRVANIARSRAAHAARAAAQVQA